MHAPSVHKFMSIRRSFDINYPVHIISRAVEGRSIFKNEIDCFRYIFQIYAANIGRSVRNLWRQDVIKVATAILNGEKISSKFVIKEHDPLVYFLDFSLVVNHNHFYLVSNEEKNIPIFMQKLNAGFATYVNLKYGRKGALFANRYKSVIVKNQFQSDAVSRYVSIANPLDVFQPGWREAGIKNRQEAFSFLANYQFSSFPDRLGIRNSEILASPETLERFITINSKGDYKEFVEEFLKERSNFESNQFFIE